MSVVIASFIQHPTVLQSCRGDEFVCVEAACFS